MTHLTPTDLIFIPVPEDAHSFEIEVNNKNNWLIYSVPGRRISEVILTDLDLQILGTITATEVDFDAAPHLKQPHDTDGCENPNGFYWDYINECFDFNDSNESIRSLLSSHDLNFVNPLGEKPTEPKLKTTGRIASYLTILDRWQAAENKLVKKGLIIKKAE